MQGSQPVENLLNACGVQSRSVRYRGCWTPPPAACQTPRRPSPKAPSMGADLDRTSACARTMLGIFEPECRVPGLRQSAAALLRQIAWAGLSGRVTAEALPRCFGGVRRAGSPVLVSWRRAKAAAAEVEHARTRQVARIGNNLNQIARWASWCSMKSGRKPSTSSRMVRAIARKPCGVIRSGGMSKARNVLSSQTCRLIIGDSGERVSMGQASGLPAGSLDRARTAHRLQSCSAIPATRPTAVRGRSPMNTSSTLSATLVHPSAYYAT